MSVEVAEVIMWGTRIGALAWDPDRLVATFEFDRDFQRSGIQVAPLVMPLGSQLYAFPELDRATYWGLPGMIADGLPDKFGNALIDAWLVQQGRSAAAFSPVERLCYIGSRGMGALEYRPATERAHIPDGLLDIERLTVLASRALAQKDALDVHSHVATAETLDQDDLAQIIRVGTSAGGARAKAVIGWNPATQRVRSGQLDLPSGYEHWLLKFDGVANNRDKELADPAGFGRIEYAYSLMAGAAGIDMAETRLLTEGPRAHFMTRRFDRVDSGRLHLQSLAAMAHFDFNRPGAYSYEQALAVMSRLGLGASAATQQFRRAVFNVVARNQDDHTKNISFLMDRSGTWRLSPAYDMTYAWNPGGAWTSQHQMTVNGKRDGFDRTDLMALASSGRVSPQAARNIIGQVQDATSRWLEFAEAAGVGETSAAGIANAFRDI